MIIATKEQAEFLAYLMANTHQTGSVAYGIPNPEDYDRFCTETVMGEVIKRAHDIALIDIDPEYKESMHAIKFDLIGCKYNVFVVPDNEIESVKLVTEFITRAYGLHHNGDKAHRVFLFRTLREHLRLWCGTTVAPVAPVAPVTPVDPVAPVAPVASLFD